MTPAAGFVGPGVAGLVPAEVGAEVAPVCVGDGVGLEVITVVGVGASVVGAVGASVVGACVVGACVVGPGVRVGACVVGAFVVGL